MLRYQQKHIDITKKECSVQCSLIKCLFFSLPSSKKTKTCLLGPIHQETIILIQKDKCHLE